MSRTRRTAATLAATTALLLTLGLAPRASAEPTIDIGWWTTSQLGGVPIGQAATVPDGGSQVASGANGPTSIAAVRFAAADGTTTEYRVELESASTPDTAAVAACPITSGWSPVRAGTFDDAPTWDCSVAQTSQAYDPTSNTVSWTFGPDFVRGGVVDVMLLPTADGLPFTLTMAPPAGDAVRVESAPAPPATTAPTTSEMPTTSVSSVPTRPVPTTVTPSPTFAPVATTPPVPTTATPTASAPAGLASPLPTTMPVAVAARTAGGASGPGRAVGVAALAFVVAAGVALARGGMGLPILTEPDGARGVGRFRHVRDEPPIDI